MFTNKNENKNTGIFRINTNTKRTHTNQIQFTNLQGINWQNTQNLIGNNSHLQKIQKKMKQLSQKFVDILHY